MIILQDLFSILATGVYANTAFSGTDNFIKEMHYEKVANAVNLGILELHKRFKFLENELSLHITPETVRYYLRSERTAILSNISPALYIEKDTTTDGFLNIIKVTGAYDSSGSELTLNKLSTVPTIMEIAQDILQITNITVAQTINIVYQSYPTKIPVTDFDPDGYQLNIPAIIIDPLVSYVAAKTFKPMGSNDSTANADKSASYEQAYELACQKLMLYGLSVQDTTERDTFDNRGWV